MIRVTTVWSPLARDSISTCGSWSEYLIALSIRLRKMISRSIGRARTSAGSTLELDDLGGQVIPHAGGAGARAEDFGQLDVAFGFDRLLVEPGGVEQVVDQVVEPLDVVEHEAVEIGLPLLVDVPPAERLQVELQRGDRAISARASRCR